VYWFIITGLKSILINCLFVECIVHLMNFLRNLCVDCIAVLRYSLMTWCLAMSNLCSCLVCSVVAPAAASDKELRMFHSAEYVDCLQRLSQLDDTEKYLDDLEEFGLGKQHSA